MSFIYQFQWICHYQVGEHETNKIIWCCSEWRKNVTQDQKQRHVLMDALFYIINLVGSLESKTLFKLQKKQWSSWIFKYSQYKFGSARKFTLYTGKSSNTRALMIIAKKLKVDKIIPARKSRTTYQLQLQLLSSLESCTSGLG